MRRALSIAYAALLVMTAIASAELMARLDDWLRLGVPLTLHSYNHESLVLHERGWVRGMPSAVYRKWTLNRYGFRGPEIELAPTPGRLRIMVLGASESLGLYESQGGEYPALLRETLAARTAGRLEVINTSLAGITASRMVDYWDNWLATFRPDVVLVYASPIFYLGPDPPAQARAESLLRAQATPLQPALRLQSILASSRMIERLEHAIEMPLFVNRWRQQRRIASLTAERDKDWFYATLPKDRLELYAADITMLVGAIRTTAAQPVLVTYAIRSAIPPRREDAGDLDAMRAQVLRPTSNVIAEFVHAANQTIRELAQREHLPVIDLASRVGGQRHLFADLVHFTDTGAAAAADFLADRIQPPSTAGILDRQDGRVH